jgi:hypothetical protein
MNGYDKALAEAVRMMERYSPISSHTDGFLIQKVSALYEPGVTKARDIATILGKSVQQIERIISQVVEAERA